MRLKHIKDADKKIAISPYIISNPKDYKGKWSLLFNNSNDIEVEIGTGKGKFIISKALSNQNTNYIGIEKYDSPLVSAVKKLNDIDINNLRIVCFDAVVLLLFYLDCLIDSVFYHYIQDLYLKYLKNLFLFSF